MNGVRKIERLEPDGQIHVRLACEVDFDELLLHLLAVEGLGRHWADGPTYLADWPELDAGRFRNVPCHCGDEHAYDVRTVSEGANQRGSYLGVMTRRTHGRA